MRESPLEKWEWGWIFFLVSPPFILLICFHFLSISKIKREREVLVGEFSCIEWVSEEYSPFLFFTFPFLHQRERESLGFERGKWNVDPLRIGGVYLFLDFHMWGESILCVYIGWVFIFGEGSFFLEALRIWILCIWSPFWKQH